MPFKSKKQMRKFYAMEEKGEIPKGTTEKWKEHTEDLESLPEKATKESVDAEIVEFFQKLGSYFNESTELDKEWFDHAAELTKQGSIIKTVEPVEQTVSKEDIPAVFSLLKQAVAATDFSGEADAVKLAIQGILGQAMNNVQPVAQGQSVIPGQTLAPFYQDNIKMTGPTSQVLSSPDIINSQGPIGNGDITNSARGVSVKQF